MPTLLIYLLQVNAALLLFYIVYHLLLRYLTFFISNRFFLLLSILFSLLYPLINFSLFAVLPLSSVASLSEVFHVETIQFISQPTHFWRGWQLIMYVFWIGFVIISLRLVLQIASLYFIHRKSTHATYRNWRFRKVDADINPFSFWQTIYLNPAKHSGKELDTILQHELIHVEQWHIADILLAELITIVCWCNPAAWLIKGVTKENLEFIVDRQVLKKISDYKSYQYLLLHLSRPKRALTVNFTTPALKKRIEMMNKTPSSKKQAGAYIILFPVLMMCYVFSQLCEEFTPVSIAIHEKVASYYQHNSAATPDLAEYFSNRGKSALIAIDTIPGTAAHIRKLSSKTQSNEMIVFLVDGKGRGIDVEIKMDRGRIARMKLLNVALPDYKPAQEFVKTFKLEK